MSAAKSTPGRAAVPAITATLLAVGGALLGYAVRGIIEKDDRPSLVISPAPVPGEPQVDMHTIDVQLISGKGEHATLVYFPPGRLGVPQILDADGAIELRAVTGTYAAATGYSFLVLDGSSPRVHFVIDGEELLKLKHLAVEWIGEAESLESLKFTPAVEAMVVPFNRGEVPQ